uniref:Uncharacterized protein n=1 Tax=Rhizophora mucronata TaxID=61149 RepID=A0A2P2NV72_RHIMU
MKFTVSTELLWICMLPW